MQQSLVQAQMPAAVHGENETGERRLETRERCSTEGTDPATYAQSRNVKSVIHEVVAVHAQETDQEA